ncbi:HAMP domain-containing histidine kinase [Tissierella pigra]|uniref:sensor histidine kinase n=1 Tax=Tissierella pigra TaxID=2607614 RepID=UPI001C113E9E|nr:HAMP domain-containing sensor histidine kinase [Tissierella pigra]MBU5426923.1 HAMP domain-containing histidine kinase [Tissierella pigra]
MKLSWKVFFSTLIITILTFSIGGYFLISAVFQSALNRESSSALEENKMLRSYFGAVIPTSTSEEQSKASMVNISESIISHFTNDKLSIRISDDEQNIIAQSDDVRFDVNLLKQLEDNSLLYKTIEYNGRYYIQTASILQTFSGKVYIETIHDISSIFTDRQNLFSSYRKFIFCMLVVNGLLVFLMTLWTLSPLKRLSNTTREIAKGKYSDRVVIQTKDEIGLLAEDFNKMADSLETKILDLEATTISQRDFIGSFAHEVKTPLTSIIGYADMLRSKRMSEENRILAADYIFNEGKRLEVLSLKLLDLLVVKNHEFEMKEINMKELFNNIKGIMEPTIKGSNILLEISAEDIQIRVEEDLIKTLIINLIDNGRKAIQGSGIINLTGKRISDERFIIIVKDNGKGMTENELSRITEMFYMVDKSRVRDKGVGIGLSLCKEIVELHGGEMNFESQVDIGTSVYLDLRG